MSLSDTINTQLVDAMKAGDQFKLDVLRMAKSALMNATIAKPDHQLSHEEEISTLQKEVKKRRESATMYKDGGRAELAEKEEKEATLLEQFLPAQMGDEEIEAAVKNAIASTGATSKQDMSKVMGAVMPALKGKADGGRISAIVQRLLP